ncbi:MAG TPA: methyltransferase domain-containing protein [Myxococcota bacterium]|nr:methyltransferase domain-containing protein [Myxococcota bacterium]HQK51162.1 methyltransferase domain-containing protein [Myxococcota bacterium]
MLNDTVRPWLQGHLAGPYRLDDAGRDLVIRANAALDDTYRQGHDHRPAAWWSRMVHSRLEWLPPAHRDTLVDVGCGSGLLTRALMSTRTFRQCLSVDLSAAQLAALRRHLAEEAIEGVWTARADVHRLPLPSESVDCVAGNSMLHHLPDVLAFLGEVHRVLRPGGVLLLTHEPTVSAERLEGLLRRPIASIRRRLRGLPRSLRASGSPPAFTDLWVFDQAGIRQCLVQAGFDEVRIEARGFLATPPLSLWDHLSVRLLGRLPPPEVYGRVRDVLDRLDAVVFGPWLPPDRFSSFGVVARKGSTASVEFPWQPFPSLFRCPEDQGVLEIGDQGLRNPRTGRLYRGAPSEGFDFVAEGP